jgi:peptidoglycan/LPS O-acetylase OafA/YrhL
MGVLAAVLVRDSRTRSLLLSYSRWLFLGTCVLFVGMAFMAYRGFSPFESPMNTLGYSWIGLFYTALLLIAVLPGARRVQSLLSSRYLIFLGTIAYCGYLIHMPLIYGFRDVLLHFKFSQTVTSFAGGLLGVGATLILATISWKFFEEPLLRRGRSYGY